MPYVEVWVEPEELELSDKQQAVLRLLIKLSREACATLGRNALSDALADAAAAVSKEFDLRTFGVPPTDPVFAADKKYLEWQEARKAHRLDQRTRT